MNKTERNKLMEKVNEYDNLDIKIRNIEQILSLPSYVENKYGKQETIRVNMSFTFGNGTSHYDITIHENNYAFDEIFKIISKQKEVIEEQIQNL